MPRSYLIPGVFREQLPLGAPAQLPSGIAGFVGVADAVSGSAIGRYEAVTLHRPEDYRAFFAPGSETNGARYLESVTRGFFANGGRRCYVVGVAEADFVEDKEQALLTAIDTLGLLNDVDLVAAPDAMALMSGVGEPSQQRAAVQRVQRALVDHCTAQGDRMAILDPPEHTAGASADEISESLRSWFQPIAEGRHNAALYYPWLKVKARGPAVMRAAPPCGHIAGVYARSDATHGVFKAPANEELFDALDLEFPVSDAMQERLHTQGINCLRAFPGRGLRVWGARTLSADSAWRYVNVRRLLLALGRWVERNMSWAAFEPNAPRLWRRIQRELEVHLEQLWRHGALQGRSSAEAFYVKCDADTNPLDLRDQGNVQSEIGLAAVIPAEFLVVRIVHRPGAISLS